MKALELCDVPRPSVTESTRSRVLIVDDEPLIRWSIGQTLAARGWEVVEVGDAAGARSALRAGKPFAVVVLDYRLPDSDDLSLLASVRGTTPGPQVIMMTAFGGPEMVHSALELGAFRVVNKPFDLDAIAELVALASGRERQTH